MSAVDIAAHSLYGIGTKPISEESPCGENVRYDSDFEELEAELAKQESLSAETVDWNVVTDRASSIIQESSKDLLVATYLCHALLMKEGYPGLAVGLNVLNDMVDQFWDDLFPPAKRMRARQSAISWLAEKSGAYISEHPPAVADSAVVIEAHDKLKQLDGTLVEKMGDQAPMLNDLSAPLKNYRQSAEADVAQAEQASAAAAEKPAESPAAAESPATVESPAATESPVAVAEASPAPAPVAPPVSTAAVPKPAAAAVPDSGALESEADTKKILRQLQAPIRDVALFWLTQKLSDSRAYRLGRLSVWMVIENAPPDNNGVTQINPPAAERLKFFEVEQEKGNITNLIPELEKTLARSPFWLDGHFQVVKALRGLGAEYEDAAQTVVRELGSFLERMPEVMNLSFSDETPFANDQALMWINAEVVKQGEESGAESGGGQQGEPWDLALAQARPLAASGENEKALTLVNDGLVNATQIRDQIYWRSALAELLLQTGKAGEASSILESLSQQLQARQMAEWEPRLLSKIYSLLFQSYQKQQKSKKGDDTLKEKAEKAFEQLCWFDPVTALSLKGD